MTNWFFGMVTILQFVTIKKMALWQKFERDQFFRIVNCQIVNNCCHDKDLKEIFKSDVIRLVVSFKSLSMQTSSIYKCKPVNMYIIVAMAKI